MTQSLDLGNSLMVALIGMLIVFFGLIVLFAMINILTKATEGMGKPKAKKEAAPAPAPKAAEPAAPVAAAPAADVTDDALIAVITAAVACMMDDGSAFTVRRVRRVSNSPAWQKAGREEQIYSRF